MLGQEFDGKATKENFDPGFDPLQSFSGKITQVEFWNTILTPIEIQKIANCDASTTKSQNRTLTWKPKDWILSGQTKISDIPLKDLCQINIISNQLIWPRAISFDKFSSYCNLVNGIPPLVYKSSQKEEMYNNVKEIFVSTNKTFPSGFLDKTTDAGIRCFTSKTNSDIGFWLGIKWNQNEGKWYSPFNQSVNFSEFNEKIAEQEYNCAYIYSNLLYTQVCKNTYPCGICRVPQYKLIHLKGLCKYGYDLFDFQYYIYGLKNNRPYFK